MNESYICSCCKKKFSKARSDEESLEESDILFPDLPKSDLVVVCEPCFIKIMDHNEPGVKRYLPYIEKEKE